MDLNATRLLGISPVLPSASIERDIRWYDQFMGLELLHQDNGYAVMRRENLSIHLQWHAGTADDPLLGGSVIKIFVINLRPLFHEFVRRGTINREDLRLKTQWGTNEFGFYDLNRNAIFIVEDMGNFEYDH